MVLWLLIAVASPVLGQQPVVPPTAATYTQPAPSSLIPQQPASEPLPEPPVSDAAPVGRAAAPTPSASEIDARLSRIENWLGRGQDVPPLVVLTGLLQYDTGFFTQDANSKATLGDIQNGTGFRRARLQALGNVTPFTSYSIEMDFAFAGHPSFLDVWLQQADLPVLGSVRIGQYRQPITMDSWTNPRHLEFLERSAPFQAFDPFRRLGIMFWDTTADERTLWACSLYATGFTFFNGTDTTYNALSGNNQFGTTLGSGASVATRITHLLWYDEPSDGRYLLHIGGGYNFSEIGGSGTTGSFARAYQARSIPEFFVGDPAGGLVTAAGTPAVVDTGRFLANSFNLWHAELAANIGPAHFQTEYLATTVNQLGGPVVFYDGAYAQCGYFLTGESCCYDRRSGVLDYNVQPYTDFFGLGRRGARFGGWGAWEVAFRWSYLDLSATNIRANNFLPAPTGPPPSPNPGILNESTVALNWWWNRSTRVQFNWIHSMLQNNAHGFSAMDISAIRVQLEF
jgi:phosphate-selective porin OprO/OprP